jgi:hypothetical protein
VVDHPLATHADHGVLIAADRPQVLPREEGLSGQPVWAPLLALLRAAAGLAAAAVAPLARPLRRCWLAAARALGCPARPQAHRRTNRVR